MIVTAIIFLQSPLLASDNFVVPKAFVLVLAAFGAALARLWERGELGMERLDVIPASILALGLVSAATAWNSFYAVSAAGALAASVLLYWTSRSLASRGRRSALLAAVLVSTGVVAVSALLEAAGALHLSDRAPGGTIGNRNRMAHLLVVAAPALVLLATRVRNRWALGLLLALCASSSAGVLLSRSRGAWLAALMVAAAAAGLLVLRCARGFRPRRGTIPRLAAVAASMAAGLLLAAGMPNQLDWKSSTPYRDSARALLAIDTGSGAGRLAESWNTVRMALDHPVLGVGPGNWRIHYPRYASPGDRTVTRGFLPVRRFPQSDWFGAAAERGVVAFLLTCAFFGMLLMRWVRSAAREPSRTQAGYAVAGVATLAGIAVTGVVDPVLQTPMAGFVAPVLLGVYASSRRGAYVVERRRAVRVAALATVAVAGVFFAQARAREVWAVRYYGYGASAESLQRAVRITPGDYRVRYLMAATWVQAGDCAAASGHIRALRQLFPTARAYSPLQASCSHAEAPPPEPSGR